MLLQHKLLSAGYSAVRFRYPDEIHPFGKSRSLQFNKTGSGGSCKFLCADQLANKGVEVAMGRLPAPM